MPAGAYGRVATGHARTTAAAADMLRNGGNAYDAAVAAGFAAAVAEPMFTSLGGGGFLLARTAEGRERVYDFFTDAPGRGLPESMLEPHFVPMTVHFPASVQVFDIGLGSVAVPGTLAGLLYVHEHLGRLPLKEVIAPAVAMARDGVVLTGHQAYVIGLLDPINTLTEAGRKLYAPEGRRLAVGDRLRNPELADFVEGLPGSARDFYQGALAQQISRDMRDGQGLLTHEDLGAYRVIEREPLALDFRGHRLLTNPPPSFGGSLVALALSLHEACGEPERAWGSASHVCRLAAVMQEVDRMRDEGLAAGGELEVAAGRVRRACGGTTHVSVSDADGNAASMTVSNGEGSGYLAPGAGVMLNNMLGEDDLHPEGFHASPPGHRVASMMSPSLVLRDGAVRLIVGSGGSKRIRTALVQVISGIVDFERGVRESVEAPRLHWDGEQLQLEPGFPAESLEALRSRWPVNEWEERNLYFGGAHAVDPRGEAGADPRRDGRAEVVGDPA
jgi:gamma-glutamyltranspeptidase/glutathione hydrolase